MTLYDKNTINRKEWQQLVESSVYGSWFQTPAAFDFYSSVSTLQPFVYGVAENDELKGVVCGYITADGNRLKRYFSRRAIIQGGVLLAEDISEKALAILLKGLKEKLSKKIIYVEIRNNNDYSKFKPTFESTGFKYLPHLNFLVDTRDNDKMLAEISPSSLRKARKAASKGVVVTLTKKQEDIDGFYEILFNLYRHKVRKPLFSKDFFEKIVELGEGLLFVARYSDKVIGGMVCVSFNDKILYEWFVCGDKNEYNHLHPSVYITYKVLQFAAEHGYEKFDFMGAGKPNVDYGVRDFKQKFGGELVEWGRYIYICNKILHRLGSYVIEKLNLSKN